MVTGARDPFGTLRVCRGCGCTENHACTVRTPTGLSGCSWVLLDIDAPGGICSACAVKLQWDGRLMGAIGTEDEHSLFEEEAQPPRLLVAS